MSFIYIYAVPKRHQNLLESLHHGDNLQVIWSWRTTSTDKVFTVGKLRQGDFQPNIVGNLSHHNLRIETYKWTPHKLLEYIRKVE